MYSRIILGSVFIICCLTTVSQAAKSDGFDQIRQRAARACKPFIIYLISVTYVAIIFQFRYSKLFSFPMTLVLGQQIKMGLATLGKASTTPTYNSLFLSFPVLTSCSDECSSRGGTNSGSCASGYGVCCTCKKLIVH